ncbi:P-loop containing nucleoside triphosphate hydrolase protein [Fimicolochytrium jonesii]|uniref:P-loop containing nucleoside triphosphate hydrolase protein n=1 Tax=Fimicolochytrium jonesii TaxID=1396493 RepID=UPI0022FED8FB|nr:P-loop containing nucleoside triphosphate hydrolase protein [Fimicolochytrium jonesii]KAI8819051.1 P-loop containing nucleoside triphosphate hydrolase protein [Fimicolochytrium jonesii]
MGLTRDILLNFVASFGFIILSTTKPSFSASYSGKSGRQCADPCRFASTTHHADTMDDRGRSHERWSDIVSETPLGRAGVRCSGWDETILSSCRVKFPYNETIVAEVRSIPDANWHTEEKIWLVPIVHHQTLAMKMKQLHKVNAVSEFRDIPGFVLAAFNTTTRETVDEMAETLERVKEALPPKLYERLMPFQKSGLQQIVRRKGKVLLGDEMGLGKTIQAIATCYFYRSEWPVLIICPSSLRLTWKAEIIKWLDVPETDIQVIFTAKDLLKETATFAIVSYDLASRKTMEDQLVLARFKVIVADESHYLKSRDAKRTKCILPLIKRAKRALLLSGTPALSRPIELFTQIGALVQPFTSATQFGVRYCDGRQSRYGWDFTGASNSAELHWYLERTVLVRRLKKDVLKQLPEKTRQCVYVEVSAKAKAALKKLKMKEEKLEDARAGGTEEKQAKIMENQRSNFIEMYKETGMAKLPAVLEYLTELYNHTTKKFIVFAHHLGILSALSEEFTKLQAKFIKIDGSTPAPTRQPLCDTFQTDPETRVAVLGITAAGVGLTLNAADLVIFAELFWNPGQILQGEDRAHRIGRKGNVDVKYILANDTLDDVQWPLISRKLDVVGQSLDGVSATMDTIEDTSTKEEREKRKQPRIDTVFGVEEGGDGEEGDVLDELLGISQMSQRGNRKRVDIALPKGGGFMVDDDDDDDPALLPPKGINRDTNAQHSRDVTSTAEDIDDLTDVDNFEDVDDFDTLNSAFPDEPLPPLGTPHQPLSPHHAHSPPQNTPYEIDDFHDVDDFDPLDSVFPDDPLPPLSTQYPSDPPPSTSIPPEDEIDEFADFDDPLDDVFPDELVDAALFADPGDSGGGFFVEADVEAKDGGGGLPMDEVENQQPKERVDLGGGFFVDEDELDRLDEEIGGWGRKRRRIGEEYDD